MNARTVSARVALLLTVFVASSSAFAELLVFSTDNCHACQLLKPTVSRLLDEGFPVRQIDVAKSPELARHFQVTEVPCLIMLKEGRLVHRMAGPASYRQIRNWFDPRGERLAPRTPTRPDQARPTADRRFDAPPASLAPNRLQGAGRGGESDPAARAMAATVRLQVEDDHGQSYGTGTVIDVKDQVGLVITCGHIFRASQGKGQITADLFGDQESRGIAGTLLQYDLDEDIALVTLPLPYRVTPVPVATEARAIRSQDRVFSIGCNRGSEPTVEQSHIVDINRYLGPENLVIQGEPVDGRSGGGLFSSQGELIGICNAADPERSEGLYAGLPVVHRLLDRTNLSFVYRNVAPAGSVASVSSPRSTGSSPAARDAEGDRRGPVIAPASFDQDSTPTRAPTARGASNRGKRLAQPARIDSVGTADSELICIVRSKTGESTEVIVLDQPTEAMLQTLRQRGRGSRLPDVLSRTSGTLLR